MEFMSGIVPVLWKILDKHRNCSINVSTIDEKLTVNILQGRRKKTFAHHDSEVILQLLKHYLLY